MQHYLEQLDKINNLLVQQPNDFWSTIGTSVVLLLSLSLLIAGLAFIGCGKPITILFDSTLSRSDILRRGGYITIGLVFMIIATSIAPSPNAVPAESERNIHNTLMDMNDVDYKTLVEGTSKYQLSNSDQAKYKTIIAIIQKASKVRPVK